MPLNQLLRTNPKLTPKELVKLFPKYKDFQSLKKSYGLWMPKEKLHRITSNSGKHEKIMLLISGVSAGGKDAVREKIEELKPNLLHKVVTATDRKIREDEKHGVDYYFYKKPDFIKAAKGGKFIEHTPLEGGRIYGLPKKSLSDSLSKPQLVICSHVEMGSGWPGVEKYFEEEYSGKKPFIIKVFVVPNMNFSKYADWLKERRADWKTRLKTAAWEISVAADKADIILTNTMTENTSEALAKEAQGMIKMIHLPLAPQT